MNVWHNHTGSASDTTLYTQYPGGLVFFQNHLLAIDQNALSLDVSSPPFNSFPEVISLSGASDPVGLTVTPNDLYLLTADAGLNEGAIYDICGTQIGTFDGLNPGSAIGVAYNAHY